MIRAAVLAVLALLALAVPASAAVRLSYATTSVRLVGASTPDRQYDSDTSMWLRCPGRAVGLMAGWSGVAAPIATIYSNNLAAYGYLGLAVRKPLRSGTFTGRTLCATGVRVTTKDSPPAANAPQTKVSCGRSQLAIGVAVDGGPYWREAVVSKPDGLRGWVNTERGYARAKVVCVPARAFARPKLVKKTASFKAGAATTTVSATCDGGRRPLGWGYEAGTLPGNVWRSADNSALFMAAAFVAAAKPQGSSGWSLTFATPDGRSATSATPLALHLTCAIPAS